MLKIRLARTGKKKQANYRVVVADQRRAVTAKFNEILGWYNPHTKELQVNNEKVEEWLSKGAQPSNTLAILLKKNGVKLPEWIKIVEKQKKPKKAVEESSKEPVASSQEEVAPGEEVTEGQSAEENESETSEAATEEAAAEIEETPAEAPAVEETPKEEEAKE